MGDNKQFFKGLLTGAVIIAMLVTMLKWGTVIYTMANGQAITQKDKVDVIVQYLEEYCVFDLDYEAMEEEMYAGLVSGVGDRYTSYMSKEVVAAFLEEMSGSYAGIGVYISEDKIDGLITVTKPIEGSPGEAAGIMPGDKIIKVNGYEVIGAQMDDAIAMMKGPANTTVTLTIYRDIERRTFDLEVRRANINVPTVAYEMLENNIGYIQISAFEDPTYKQFMEAFNALNEQGQEALIIDVRDNLGGYLSRVCEIANELLPEGVIVYTEDKAQNRTYQYSDENSFGKPIALLVNGNSASASEILAGAIQDNGAGVLVGETTYGKGLVQKMFDLPDGSAVKITIEKYYTPGGVCIQGIGIEPDYIVEWPEELRGQSYIGQEEDVQLQKAISVLKNELN